MGVRRGFPQVRSDLKRERFRFGRKPPISLSARELRCFNEEDWNFPGLIMSFETDSRQSEMGVTLSSETEIEMLF